MTRPGRTRSIRGRGRRYLRDGALIWSGMGLCVSWSCSPMKPPSCRKPSFTKRSSTDDNAVQAQEHRLIERRPSCFADDLIPPLDKILRRLSPSMTQLDFDSLRRRFNCAGPPQRPGQGAWLGTPARPSGGAAGPRDARRPPEWRTFPLPRCDCATPADFPLVGSTILKRDRAARPGPRR